MSRLISISMLMLMPMKILMSQLLLIYLSLKISKLCHCHWHFHCQITFSLTNIIRFNKFISLILPVLGRTVQIKTIKYIHWSLKKFESIYIWQMLHNYFHRPFCIHALPFHVIMALWDQRIYVTNTTSFDLGYLSKWKYMTCILPS